MKIIYFVDFHLSLQVFSRSNISQNECPVTLFLFCIAEKRVNIIIKKKVTYFTKTKMFPIAKRTRKCVVSFVKIMRSFCFNPCFKG